MSRQGGPPARKESAVDLAKFVDKGVRVKLAGGREGALINCLLPKKYFL